MHDKKVAITFCTLLILLLMVGCSNSSDGTNKEMPSDFNFSLIYGTYGKQKIDTFNNLVIKDLVE